MRLSKSSPPKWVSPAVAFTSKMPSSIVKRDTSNVPPPKSKIKTLRSSPVWHGRRRETRGLSWDHHDAIAATASGSSSSFTLSPHRGAALNSMDAYSARSARSSAGCGRENAA